MVTGKYRDYNNFFFASFFFVNDVNLWITLTTDRGELNEDKGL
jgi:hypothetical protein